MLDFCVSETTLNYKKIYEDLCISRKCRGLEKERGYELHHILPKSLGGEDTEDNLVKLSYREHFIAHLLLLRVYKEDKRSFYKMLNAYILMANKRERLYSRFYHKNRSLWESEYMWMKDNDKTCLEGFLPTHSMYTVNTAMTTKRDYFQPFLIDNRKGSRNIFMIAAYAWLHGYKGIYKVKSRDTRCEIMMNVVTFNQSSENILTKSEISGRVVYTFKDSFVEAMKRFKEEKNMLNCVCVKGIPSTDVGFRWNCNNPRNLIRVTKRSGMYMLREYNRWEGIRLPDICQESYKWLTRREITGAIQRMEL